MNKNNLDQDDVYIIDLGLHLYILIGKDSQGAEAYNAAQFCHKINKERKGRAKIEIIDKQDNWNDFDIYKNLPEGERTYNVQVRNNDKLSLYRLTDRESPT